MDKKKNHPSADRLLAAVKVATKGRVASFLDLYKDMGESPQTMKNWRERETGVSLVGAKKAEGMYGCSVTWIIDGVGKPPSVGAPIAHQESDDVLTVELQLLEWGDGMDRAREEFRAVMPDDAMEPEVEEGWEIVLQPAKSAKPGQGVLVKAGDGRRYFRVFHEGSGDGWEAHPIKKSYRALHEQRDELEIIAVMKYVKKPRLG